MKKVIVLIVFLLLANTALAKEITVKIKPEYKITTSDVDLVEGDNVDFVVSEDVFINSKQYLRKGQQVTGVVTSIENNGFFVVPAKICIEHFKVVSASDSKIKLKGIVYKIGSEHPKLNEIFIFDLLLRGGEVQIVPEKDEFTMYIEDNL